MNRAEPKPEPVLYGYRNVAQAAGEIHRHRGKSPGMGHPQRVRVPYILDEPRGLPSSFARVVQFGNAELIGRYPSAKAKYLPEADSEQVQ